MRIADMDWRMVEDWLRGDDRGVLPLGSVEQHAGLSLAVDMILAERVAVEAAEPLGVPVFPALPFGLAPYFQAFPGSMTLRVETYVAVVRELPDCRVRFHDWWRAPKTMAQVQATDTVASHASWMENFPWTRLPSTPADGVKDMVDTDLLKTLPPFESRNLLDDGNFGGRTQRSDNEMLAIWNVAVEETRALLEAL